MHGFLTGTMPTGGKLKGAEFQRVKRVLAGSESMESPPTSVESAGGRGDSSGEASAQSTASPNSQRRSTTDSSLPLAGSNSATLNAQPSSLNVPQNVPLIDSPLPHVRELHNIDEKLIRDIAAMNPAAAGYLRRHPCLTPESMAKWWCGYLPNDGGGDKRGWSLRGNILYPVLSEQGKVLAWVGRDVQYEQKDRDYQALIPAERQTQEPPAKHRFPKGFHRGQELFGQHASRLQEPGYREFIQQHGLTLVEGANDVIGLDNLGVPSLGIMSNRMTTAQGEKVFRFSQQLGTNRVNLMFDCEDSGTQGAKEALWYFAERRIDARLIWSPIMHSGAFKGQQPESLRQDDVASLFN